MNTYERVKKIVADVLEVGEEKITPETALSEDLGADSLDKMEIALALEEEFCLPAEDDVPDMPTIASIVAYVESRLQEGRP